MTSQTREPKCQIALFKAPIWLYDSISMGMRQDTYSVIYTT